MASLADRFRTRFLPALLTATGVTLLAAGLLTYTTPVVAETVPSAEPTLDPDPSTAVVPTPSPLITLPPLTSAAPEASPTPNPDRRATRVRIAALDIDLPIIKGPAGYPKCDVAMYLKELHQPGSGKATYLFAHAREGMFLPLLETRELTIVYAADLGGVRVFGCDLVTLDVNGHVVLGEPCVGCIVDEESAVADHAVVHAMRQTQGGR